MQRVDSLKLEYIVSLLEKMDYGSLNIIVHNGEITQIDTTEKKRFPLKQTTK